MDFGPELGISTLLGHFGEDEKIKGAVIPPLFQNSLFVFDTYEEFCAGIYGNPEGPPYHYSRIGNPTVELAERKIAMLEGAEACKLIGTGMGALAISVISSLEAGGHIVSVDTCYGTLLPMMGEYLKRFGVETTFVTGLSTEDLLDAIRPETTTIYLESPSSLMFRLQDIEKITRVAKEKGITTVMDNTWSTPLFQNPIPMGVDIVVHSATKYMGGHSDLTAGAICTTRERMDRIVREEVNFFGSILSPFPAWLLTRGLRSLPVRMRQHEQTGNEVATWIANRAEVEVMHHPGLPNAPQRDLFEKQMRGCGSLFSFEPRCQDQKKIVKFVESLRIFSLGVSWGGFESLAVPIQVKPIDYPEERWLIRLFCGLEEAKDLVHDLEQAFDQAEMA